MTDGTPLHTRPRPTHGARQRAREDEDDRRRRAGVVAYGREGKRWWEGVGFLRWLFEDNAEGLGLLIAWIIIAGVAGHTIWDARESFVATTSASPTRAVRERSSDNTRAFLVRGRDSWGRRAVFDVLVSVRSLGWVHGSTSMLEQDGAQFSGTEIRNRVFDAQVRRRLAQAKAWIAVGLASQEGDRDAETQRAMKRAEQTAEWLLAASDEGRPLYTLNLGQYKTPCESCEDEGTSWQRPLIAIGVLWMDPGVDLKEALVDGFERAKNLPSPWAYSHFDLAVK